MFIKYLVITYLLPSILIMTVWKLKYFYHFFLQVSDAAINLKGILNSYHDGQNILDNYAKSNKLNGLLRNKLSHILITHFLKKSAEKKIL